MIKQLFSAFILGALTLSIQAMEKDDSTTQKDTIEEKATPSAFEILPYDIMWYILSLLEPNDVITFALTKKEYAQLVNKWLENPQAIGSLIMRITTKMHSKDQDPSRKLSMRAQLSFEEKLIICCS